MHLAHSYLKFRFHPKEGWYGCSKRISPSRAGWGLTLSHWAGQRMCTMCDAHKNPRQTEAKSVTIFLSLVNNVICFSPVFFPLFLAHVDNGSRLLASRVPQFWHQCSKYAVLVLYILDKSSNYHPFETLKTQHIYKKMSSPESLVLHGNRNNI